METEAGNNANDTDAGTTTTTQEKEIVVSDAANEDEDAFWEKHQEDLESKLFRMYRGALHETPQGSQTSTWAKRAYQEFLRNTQTQSKDEVPNDPQAWKCMHDLALAACASGAHVNLVMFHAARIPLAVRQHLFDMLIIECCRNGHADALKSLVSMALVSEFTVELSDFIDEIGPSPSLDLGIMDEANNSAIHMACLHGYLECVRCLVETGEDDVNRRSRGNASSGATPLHAAAMGGHIDIIAYLLKAGAEPSPLANDGTSPLHLACARDRADAVKFLMFRTDQDPFTQAASGQRRSIPSGALAGSSVDESQDSLHIAGLSAFETAAIFASSNAVRAILHMVSSDVAALVRRSRASVEQPQRGKDGNAPDSRSGSAADSAAHRPESVVARQGLVPFMFRSMLLALSSYAGEEDEVTQDEARAEIITNISNFLPPEKLSKVLSMHYKGVPGKADIPTEIRGDTLLHVGARLGRGRCVQALLNAGADVTVRNVKGETAVDCSMPFLLKPENTTALRAVRSLVAEWERLRVSADQTMEAMLQDEVHGAGEATGSAEPSSHEYADVRSPAKDDSVKVPGAGSRKKRTRRSKKKSKKRTSAHSASSAQKVSPATEGNENAPEKGENAHDDALSQDAGSSGSASDHETACSADSHKKSQGAEKRTGAEEVDDDGQGWVLAQGGKVKFADHEASGAGLATEEMMQKRDLQRRLVAHRVLFEQLNPEASVLGLKFEHFLGLQLSELSMSQLDTLRALHHRAQEDILEAQLNAARVQGRELAVEDRQRRANFTAFQEHYFGGLDG
ncbi:Ankyrin repeat domain-containing protein 1 [Hondaea fermentalgiana]|uniref:Ankyrin repeat domain-containing protein 1 n=1 Tax=Hondaea fermentalgiana TaxID=2315210 RepID=A0A2R5GHQ9_9STRA|nr:Ankyrin repeat domain-containing protein 1 [Hondaea fermentalgiana]|eukprot:GBG28183.1 Ankyrin repeat domain-containing protein 1 [Hondaea fermentalgiana]